MLASRTGAAPLDCVASNITEALVYHMKIIADLRFAAAVHPAHYLSLLRRSAPLGMYFNARKRKGRFFEMMHNWPSVNVQARRWEFAQMVKLCSADHAAA